MTEAPSPEYGEPTPAQTQPGYVPPAQAPASAATEAPPPPPPSEPAGRTVGVASLVFTLFGAIAAVVGLFAVRWTKFPGNTNGLIDADPKFLDLRKYLMLINDSTLPDKPTWLITYFTWAGFVLVGATLVLALLAALPTPVTGLLQALGVLVGLVSAAAALLVPKLDGNGDGLTQYLKGGVGMYFVAGGSILMGLGAAIGSSRLKA